MSNTVTYPTTKVMKCTRWCRSAFQDRKYGEGRRLCNEVEPEPSAARSFRCTVCKSVHNTARAAKKAKAEKGEE